MSHFVWPLTLFTLLAALFRLPAAATGAITAVDSDFIWKNDPRGWHQQAARVVDHRFSTLDNLHSFALEAKRAGVSVLMLVQVQKTSSCPGPWYNGLQLCDHINGTFPAADGTLERWKAMLEDIKPMRLMWWINSGYWSVQGEVWAQAKADKFSDVGRFFSWNATKQDECSGHNPCDDNGMCAQGSWGSTGSFSGVESALASYGSPTYADYLVDAMGHSWANLGIDGYTVDISGNYGKSKACPSGMMQCPNGDGLLQWAKIVGRVRALVPQLVMSGEWYGSWEEVIRADADMGGQGNEAYHTDMQAAVFNGDADTLEPVASTSGVDTATVLCYLHPHFDGQQPGACPTMYYRDSTASMVDVRQYRMWVALEAGSGVLSEHDYDPRVRQWWNVSNDPSDEFTSPLWAFAKFRALNRLALRTKLPIVAYTASDPSSYTEYAHQNCYAGHGGRELDISPIPNLSVNECKKRCDADPQCTCVTYQTTGGNCWKRAACVPSQFEHDSAANSYSVFFRNSGGGALVYLKHDSMGPRGDAVLMVFNPAGKEQNLTIDLSSLPPELYGTVPYDLLQWPKISKGPPLASNWTVAMKGGDMRFYSGFTLGVYPPVSGKWSNCRSDDGYQKKSDATTLEGCFLDCRRDAKCENVFVDDAEVGYMEKPPPLHCTLLGAVVNPITSCTKGTGTLVHSLPGARACSNLWDQAGGITPPLADRAPQIPPGPPCPIV